MSAKPIPCPHCGRVPADMASTNDDGFSKRWAEYVRRDHESYWRRLRLGVISGLVTVAVLAIVAGAILLLMGGSS